MTINVPQPILTAATGMLAPYCAGLTSSSLQEALRRMASNTEDRPAPLPESLTKADVVRSGKVSLQTVNRWIATGKLRAVKVGRAVRIPRSELEQLLTPKQEQ